MHAQATSLFAVWPDERRCSCNFAHCKLASTNFRFLPVFPASRLSGTICAVHGLARSLLLRSGTIHASAVWHGFFQQHSVTRVKSTGTSAQRFHGFYPYTGLKRFLHLGSWPQSHFLAGEFSGSRPGKRLSFLAAGPLGRLLPAPAARARARKGRAAIIGDNSASMSSSTSVFISASIFSFYFNIRISAR